MKNINDVIEYTESFLSTEEANELFEELMKYPELTSMFELEIATGEKFNYDFGKMMFLDRELVDKNAFPKASWGHSMEWSENILKLKKRIEKIVKCEFHTCVCIFYADGNSGVDYHSDQMAFGDTSIIPSISLGEERQFCLREKETMTVTPMLLKHGSLVVMKNGCQEHYEHSLPVDSKYLNPRINLTFRKYGI
ncbi:MAG: hypothetical protein ACI837_003422 [Crocinitomicaceae bacterium]|jgi:hypothetical protein